MHRRATQTMPYAAHHASHACHSRGGRAGAQIGDLGDFVYTLLQVAVYSGLALTVGSVVLWIVYSFTDYRVPRLARQGAATQDYFASEQCTLKVRLDSLCDEDYATGMSTLSGMAARWPHLTVLIVGTGVTQLFLAVALCDLIRVRKWMLLVAWVAFILFWCVVGTSDYESNETLRLLHFAVAALLILSTATYAWIGAWDETLRGLSLIHI